MKRIFGLAPFLVAITLFTSCAVLKPSPSAVTKMKTIQAFTWENMPLSDKLPNTSLTLKDKTFQLTLLQDAKGDEMPVYLPQEMYDSLVEVSKNRSSSGLRPGAYVKGQQLSAQSLGTGSIFTEKEMRKLSSEQRRIAEAYRTVEKFIVWDSKSTPRIGVTTKDFKITPVDLTVIPIPQNSDPKQNQSQKQKQDVDW